MKLLNRTGKPSDKSFSKAIKMKINSGFIEDIVELSKLKEDQKISRNQLIEFFDLIDGLTKDELAEVYASVLYHSNFSSKFENCYEKALGVGFGAVDILFEMKDLGVHLAGGVNKLEE